MTTIEWTDEVWNPVRGCSLVSAGCRSCYAMRQAHRFSGPGGAYEGLTKSTPSGPQWNGKVRLVPEALDEPLRWRKPQKVFVNSMSDLFHDDVPDGFIARVWNVMAQCPRHTFQILTKRPQRMLDWCRRWADRTGDNEADTEHGFPPMPRGPAAIRATYTSGRARLFADMLEQLGDPPAGAAYPLYDWMEGQRFWPGDNLPNVWLGTSVEDQRAADERIPLLLQTPAAVRFLSCEPLLGPVDLARPSAVFDRAAAIRRAVNGPACLSHDQADEAIGHPVDWVIVGGESGPGARPCCVPWIRSLVEQCRAAGVACFVKQMGSRAGWKSSAVDPHPGNWIGWKLDDRKGGDASEWPEDLRVREFPRTGA